jgi:Icc protein
MKIIVLTDPHMVPEATTIIGIDPYARLLAGVRHVNAHHADAACAIVAGDLTHGGDRVSYGRLREVLAQLTPPCRLMIGNHDDRATFQAAFPEAPRDAYGFVQQRLDAGNVRLLLLDTVRPGRSSGVLCARRMAWLDAELGAAAGRDVLVFMHHPPHPTGFAGMDGVRLANGPAFYRLIAQHGNVRHIVAGHVHRTISGSHRGVPFSIFKSTAHQQPMTFDSPDSSLSVDEPAAYGILFVTRTSTLVHTEDYQLSDRAPDPRRV